ncbi:kinase-like protein [Rhizophagus irregularis]|uniref:Kinase-like protein n=1 Tax=Rhizophagus irregularis TaxID=588596 RepID=A0A2N0PBD4_9GLOM|nr:kinase-like protein [Rhizophagus irregularis]
MTSVKKWIDKKIKDKLISYYKYNKFSKIVEIGRGGFGKVQRAELANTGLVALKSFIDEYSNIEEDELNRIDDEFVKEFLRGIFWCWRDYLKKKFTSMKWKDKTQMALDIACGLKFLHFKEIIHRDLHSKNILVNNGKLLIADLGLSKKLAEATTNSLANTRGMIEYTEPQCFKSLRYKKNKKSDIYSLGVLLWEISSGRPPFSECERSLLRDHIKDGNREEPTEDTPLKYQQLYQKCWESEPNSRPDIEEVYETLSQLKTEDFSLQPSPQSNINEIKNSNIDYNDDLNISDELNSKRESSYKPNGFIEKVSKYFGNELLRSGLWSLTLRTRRSEAHLNAVGNEPGEFSHKTNDFREDDPEKRAIDGWSFDENTSKKLNEILESEDSQASVKANEMLIYLNTKNYLNTKAREVNILQIMILSL